MAGTTISQQMRNVEMKTKANTRKYQNQDLRDLLTIWEAANALAHPFLSNDFVAQVRADIVELYIPNSETWVADYNGSVVGFISLIENEVGAIFVLPNHHGQGIGALLMNKACELREHLELEVFAQNTIGRTFYDCFGFLKVGESIHPQTQLEVLRLKLCSDQYSSCSTVLNTSPYHPAEE